MNPKESEITNRAIKKKSKTGFGGQEVAKHKNV